MFRVVFVLLIATAAAAQTASPETQALQALVAEIRQMRLDMQTTTITTQRVQVVLYRLQSQTALVTRAASRLEDARSSLGNTQSEKKTLMDNARRLEESLKSATDPHERANLTDAQTHVKYNLDRLSADEERYQTRQMDAEKDFRTEQTKLAGLQDQLDRLDQLLDSLTRK